MASTRHPCQTRECGDLRHSRRALESKVSAVGARELYQTLYLQLHAKIFFQRSPRTSTIDNEGEELPDRHEAWRAATVAAGGMVKEIDGKLVPGREWRLEVTDEFRNLLYVIHVSAEKPK
jgi:hypothetical protein